MKEIEVSKMELENLYVNMGIQAAMDYYGVTSRVLYRMLDKAGIPRKQDRSEWERVSIVVKD